MKTHQFGAPMFHMQATKGALPTFLGCTSGTKYCNVRCMKRGQGTGIRVKSWASFETKRSIDTVQLQGL